MNLVYNPYAVPLFLTAALLLGFAVAAWRQHGTRGERPFALFMLVLTLWIVGYAFELMSPSLPGKMLWIRLEYIGISLVAVLWLVFILNYTGRIQRIQPVFLRALFIIPTLTILFVMTSTSHSLMYAEIGLSNDIPVPIFAPQYGPWFWIHVAYSYIVLLGASIVLIHSFLRSSGVLRGQLGFALIALIISWSGSVLYMVGIRPAGLDLTPYAFSLASIPIAWSLFRFRLLDVAPIARETVFQSLQDPVLIVDTHQRIIDANTATSVLLGLSQSDLFSKQLESVLPSVAASLALQPVDDTTSRTSLELGSPARFFEANLSIFSQDGSPVGTIIVLHDVTEQREADRHLRESEARYRAIVEDQNELICRLDDSLRLTFVNEAFCRFFSLTREDMLGQYAFFYTSPDQFNLTKQNLEVLSPEYPTTNLEHLHIVDGKERWLGWRIRAVHDEDGKLVEYHGVGSDVTRRKRSEEALLERRRTMHLIFSSMPNILLVLDEDDKLVSFFVPATIDAPIFSGSRFEVGSHLEDLFNSSEIAQAFSEHVRQAREQDISVSFEQPVGDNEELSYFQVNISLVNDSTNILITADDITELKRAEAKIRQYAIQLEETNHELDMFTRTAAHDLKAPLAGIVVHTNLLLEYESEGVPNAVLKRINTVRNISNDMIHMIDDLLTLARLRNATELATEIDVEEILRTVLQRHNSQLETYDVEVVVETPIAPALGHAPWIEQILSNLIGNAIKYIRRDNPSPRIIIRGVPTDDRVRYEVEDNGPGISREKLPEVFDMFSRFDKHESGHGLGLSIVARSVQNMNGTVGVESLEGGGCTFWFELPGAAPFDLPNRADAKLNGEQQGTADPAS